MKLILLKFKIILLTLLICNCSHLQKRKDPPAGDGTWHDKLEQRVADIVLKRIQGEGIKLGNRWLIREEGTGSYEALVFRDLKTGGDKRYAFYSGRYTDLK